MANHERVNIATCIGCGCDDLHACWDEEAGHPCSWIRLDRNAGLGVCSGCPDHATRWDEGDRAIAVPIALIKLEQGIGSEIKVRSETMNHDDVLENRAIPEPGTTPSQCCGDELVFAMRDRHHTFSLSVTTVLECLHVAEQEGAIPALSDDWWIAVDRRYKIPHLD